jgi:hypothetical protein
MRKILLCSLVVLAAACGGDDGGTGPEEDANVGGRWSLAASNMSGSGLSCTLNAPLNLSQTGSTFTGTYGAGTVTCQAGGDHFSEDTQGTVVNGAVDGEDVEFDLDTQDFHHTGSVNGNSMSGTARYVIDLGGSIGVVTLNGNWSAAKQ